MANSEPFRKFHDPHRDAIYRQINIAREISRCKTCDSYICHCQLNLEEFIENFTEIKFKKEIKEIPTIKAEDWIEWDNRKTKGPKPRIKPINNINMKNFFTIIE